MRELTTEEMEATNGAVLPLIGFSLAFAGKLTGSTGFTTWAIGSGSLILATYEAARYLDGGL